MTTITMPVTVEAVHARLRQLDGEDRRADQLAKARGWSRAALVAMVVELDHGDGVRIDHRPKVVNIDHLESARSFAERGYVGLSSHVSVTYYVRTWLERFPRPQPGDVVALPDEAWPPQKKNLGSRLTVPTVTRAIEADPAIAAAAADALTKGGVEHLDRRQALDLSTAAHDKVTRQRGPTTPTPRPDPDERYNAAVQHALDVLMDAIARRERGEWTPPAHIEIQLQIVLPRKDWSDALAELIGDPR
jgi:hypothetical protein